MNKKIKIKNIVIVPARIGSKRIKEKNIKKFFGKPIIYWTLRNLKNSKIFDKIYISTDSKKIINIVKKFGFKDFILRNKTLSNDYASTQSVIIDAIKKISLKNNLDNIFCVYPCNPFLQKKDLKRAINIISKNKESFILPIVKYNHPIEKAFYYKDSKFIFRYIKNSEFPHSQLQNINILFLLINLLWAEMLLNIFSFFFKNFKNEFCFIPVLNIIDINTIQPRRFNTNHFVLLLLFPNFFFC